MPRIFDNIEQFLLPTLRNTLQISQRADFCAGYFNLRGWREIDDLIEQFSGKEGACCRLLIGMQRLPKDQVRAALSITPENTRIDNSIVIRSKKQIAQEFCEQLTLGVPSNDAVLIAVRHVNRWGGVLVGDVVGLGKTMIASALAKILEEDFFLETLIICPKNLVTMWEDYVHRYQLRAKVLSISRAFICKRSAW
jgi:hypothetical protein